MSNTAIIDYALTADGFALFSQQKSSLACDSGLNGLPVLPDSQMAGPVYRHHICRRSDDAAYG